MTEVTTGTFFLILLLRIYGALFLFASISFIAAYYSAFNEATAIFSFLLVIVWYILVKPKYIVTACGTYIELGEINLFLLPIIAVFLPFLSVVILWTAGHFLLRVIDQLNIFSSVLWTILVSLWLKYTFFK